MKASSKAKAASGAGASRPAAIVSPTERERANGVETSALVATGAAVRVAPNILSLAHGQRLLGGELYAPRSRVDWATLSRRTFDVEVKRCTGCGGRMTVRAVVTDAASVARLLAEVRSSRDPPVAA